MFLWCWLMLVVLDNNRKQQLGHCTVMSRESSLFGKCGHNSRWFSWLGYKPCMQNANTSPRWRQSYAVLAVLWGMPWSVMMEWVRATIFYSVRIRAQRTVTRKITTRRYDGEYSKNCARSPTPVCNRTAALELVVDVEFIHCNYDYHWNESCTFVVLDGGACYRMLTRFVSFIQRLL